MGLRPLHVHQIWKNQLCDLKGTFFRANIQNETGCEWGFGRHFVLMLKKVSKGAKIRNRYNQVPHLTQGTNEKVTSSQLDIANESQEVIPFPAGDHKAHKTDAHKGIANARQKKPP